MMKKYILPALMSLAVFSLNLPAFADYYDDNYYVKAPIPVASPSPYAVTDAGFVFGLEAGYANTHWSNLDIQGVSISDSGFAGRVFLGYDFNQFIGLETGYIYLPKSTADGFDGSITNYAFDFLAKLAVPVTSGLSLYAKAGLGYLRSNLSTDFNDGGDRSTVNAAFGVGAGYEVIPNLALNLSWMRYTGNGSLNSSDYQPSPDALLFGLSYKIPMRSS